MVIRGVAGIHSYLNTHGFKCSQGEAEQLCNTLEFIVPEHPTGVFKAASGDLDKWIKARKKPKKQAASTVKSRKPRVKSSEQARYRPGQV